jgi:hypothetical protein
MPTQRKKILDFLVKVDRAYRHLTELHLETQRFFDSPRPFEVDPKDNPETGERIFYLRVHKEIPGGLFVATISLHHFAL